MYDALFEDDNLEEFGGFDEHWLLKCRFSPSRHSGVPFGCSRSAGPGAQVHCHPPEARAKDYFELFFTDEMWERLVTETNRYCQQQRQQDADAPPLVTVTKYCQCDLLLLLLLLLLHHFEHGDSEIATQT